MNTKDKLMVHPNILHFRPLPEEHDDPYPVTGGITVAYYLREHQGNVIAVCGVSLCASFENFNRREGRARATGRLMSSIQKPIETHKNLGVVQYLDLGTVKDIQQELSESTTNAGLQKFSTVVCENGELGVTTVPFDAEADAGTFLFLREDDWPIYDRLRPQIVTNLMEHREATYQGDDEFILMDIENMTMDYLGYQDGDDNYDGDDDADEKDELIDDQD